MADPDDLVTGRGLRAAGSAIRWWASRSGGPGGQHANTSDTAVTIELDVAASELPDVVVERLREVHGETVRATAADSRSQYRNRQMARSRLAALIDEAARPRRTRRATRPGSGAVRRRLDDKRRQSDKKQQRSWRPDG